MKNIKRGSLKQLILYVVATIIAGLILYPLFDYIYLNFITNNNFVYSVSEHVIKPIGIGLIIAVCTWLIDKKKADK